MRNLALIVMATILLAFIVNPICRATADAPIAGTIDATLFRQLPSILVVAQTYTLIARVTNTGTEPTQYELFIRLPLTESKTPIALSTSIANFKLNPGDTKEVSFTLTPVKAEDEPFDISASLYALAPNGSILLLSTATTTVRLIRIAPSQPLVLALLALMVSSAFAWIALHYGRNAKHKKELVTSATLFAASLLIRSYNYMRVGVYQDEAIFTNQALQILSNNWRWTFYQMQNYAYPPIYIYLNALFIYLFGYGLENTRWISILAGSSLPILIYLVGSRMYGQKTGLLAGLMFLLSGEAILYSVIIRAESLTLFFLILAVYLFWVAESGGLRRWYLASGMVVGLAFDTKYTAIVTAMGFVLYFLWSRWSLKAFFDRKIALWILGFLLAIAPIQAYLMVSGANPYITFISTWITPSLQGGGSASTGFAPPKPTGVFNFLFRAFRIYVYEATRAGSPWLPWLPIYVITSCVLVVVAPIRYLWDTLKRHRASSYLTMLLLVEIPLLAFGFHTYWIIYVIPFFLLMLAHITIESIRAIKSHKMGVRQFRILRVIFLVVMIIFLASQSTVGLAEPFIDKGDSEGVRLAALYLMHNARPGALVAVDPGNVFTLLYYVGMYQLNVTVLSLILPEPISAVQPKFGSGLTLGANTAKWVVPGQILELHPDYILISRYQLTWVLNQTMKSAIYSDYKDLHLYTPPVGYDAWNYWWAEVTGRVAFVLLQRVD